MGDHNLLFEIKGIPIKAGVFKKHKSYIAVFDDAIAIEVRGQKHYYAMNDINDIFLLEPAIRNVPSRTTVIDFSAGGESFQHSLQDILFPGLAAKFETVLSREWSHITKMHTYPETIKWFIACCAIVHIVSKQNPIAFGNPQRDPIVSSAHRKVLYNSWGFNNKHDLLETLPKLLDGRTAKNYQDDDESVKISRETSLCFWAWDLQRLIYLGNLGCLCDYLTWEEALDWCLIAGQKLQGLFNSWDDFMNSYLRGYSIWAEEDLDDEDSSAYDRKQAYAYYKKLPTHPWQVAWNLQLVKEW